MLAKKYLQERTRVDSQKLSDARMLTATGLGLILMVAVLGGCIPSIGTEDILAPGVTVRFTCTGPGLGLPTWYVNGIFAAQGEENQCYRLNFSGARKLTTATLTIGGNLTCDTFNIYCTIQVSESEFQNLHNISLVFQGHLPPPENLHINVNSSTIGSVIKWSPPYSSMSNGNISVDPHITQYTVYITDNYTGDVVTENVTETQFTSNIQGNVLCPMYQVSAWNAGGEGELSDPVQPHTPHKLSAGNIVIRIGASHMLHIDFYVTEVCKTRIPSYFVVTVTTFDRVVVNTTTVHHDHQSGPQVAIRIELPQNVDMCSLLVSISAGNSAGTSLPTEIKVECPTSHSDSISTTSSGTDSSQSVETTVVIKVEQGLVGVSVVAACTAAAILVVIVLIILWTVWKHRRKSQVKSSEMVQNTSSHSLRRHPSTTAEVSQADNKSTQASSESTGTQIPVTGSSTGSDSGTWPV